MTEWDTGVLRRIAETDDFHISPFREDRATYGTPTWIWSVVVDGSLYVRPWNGVDSRWYKAALCQGAGRISAAGETFDVLFEAADPAVNDGVDAAYRAKYGDSPYFPPMVGARPRAATVRITPA
ncbi:DUF2255 family protein [Sinomonas susongensis]|uniref:DUF2255 family protein n=1 Tax=Sinomonas susongensis TaxID=1324851 RepID=UPI001108CFFE|nr:DUF2255 family protein [Sinomonas susongensis]